MCSLGPEPPELYDDLIVEFLAALEKQDIAACLTCLHADARLTDNVTDRIDPTRMAPRGRDAVRAQLERFAANWEYLALQPRTIFRRRDKQNERHCQVGFLIRHRATGEKLFGTFRFIARIEDELIKRINIIHDAALFTAFRRLVGSPRVTLPEFREAEAAPDVAAIYDEIRQATGIPHVNLIFRHLATLEGMLEWAWHILGPHYRSGRITELTRHLFDGLPPITRAGIAADLDPVIAQRVNDILTFYTHANTHNLIAFAALVRLDIANLAERPSEPEARRPVPQLPTIPALPKPNELDGNVLAVIRKLAARQGGATLGITPSLYLHLGLWPDVMAAAYDIVSRMLSSGQLSKEMAVLQANVERQITVLIAEMSASLSPPPEPVRRTAFQTIDTFVRHTIPEMVIIGRHLAGRPD